MNGYVCFHKGKRVEVYANSSYAAQQKAATMLQAKRVYEVTVMLAEVDGEGRIPEVVIHSTSEV